MTTNCRLALSALVALAPAGAGQALAAPASAADGAAAQCLMAHLPQAAQMFRAGDGSLRVVAIGRRGVVARWTVTGIGENLRIARSGGAAGLDRAVTAACLPR